MAITLNDNLSIQAPKGVDSRFGPFVNTTIALSSVASAVRFQGLTLGINSANASANGGNTVIEYWFRDGIADGDLVYKVDPTANLAFAQANAAYNAANNAGSGSATAAFNQANLAYAWANAAYNAANSGGGTSYAFNQANTAFNQANAAFNQANSITIASVGSNTYTGDGTTTVFGPLVYTPTSINYTTINYNGISLLRSSYSLSSNSNGN